MLPRCIIQIRFCNVTFDDDDSRRKCWRIVKASQISLGRPKRLRCVSPSLQKGLVSSSCRYCQQSVLRYSFILLTAQLYYEYSAWCSLVVLDQGPYCLALFLRLLLCIQHLKSSSFKTPLAGIKRSADSYSNEINNLLVPLIYPKMFYHGIWGFKGSKRN